MTNNKEINPIGAFIAAQEVLKKWKDLEICLSVLVLFNPRLQPIADQFKACQNSFLEVSERLGQILESEE
jgi:hypothetical protein